MGELGGGQGPGGDASRVYLDVKRPQHLHWAASLSTSSTLEAFMANEEHVALLKQGADAWNAWRRENADVPLNLRKADLRQEDLTEANLKEANLQGADLRMANLRGANLEGAYLVQANLERANLQRVKQRTNLRWANLRWAN